MMLNSPTFVLQRRINRPLAAVEGVLCDPQILRAGTEFEVEPGGARLRLERPFGVMFPPFGVEGASWWAPATVRSRHGRAAVRLELEINAWAPGSAELVVRPTARHPWRWSARRLRTYFRVAHLTADHLTRLLGSESARSTRSPRPAPISAVIA